MFDEQTGQVFEEKIVRLSRTNDRNWHIKVPTSLCQKSRPRQGHAYENYCKNVEQNRWPRVRRSARPLLNMSISVFMSNLHRLPSDALMQLPPHLLYEVGKVFPERFPELEALGRVPHDIFECFPLAIVEEIWITVNQRAHMNLNLWKMLSKRLLPEKDNAVRDLGLRRYRHSIEIPDSPLPFYTTPLTSPSFDFLTSLSIATLFPNRDLINLANIVNLGILEIYDTEQIIGERRDEMIAPDRLLRIWAGLAVAKNAFPVLRVLKFRLLHCGLTNASIKHFNSFPALGIISSGGNGMTCKDYDELGWRVIPSRRRMIKVLQAALDEQAAEFFTKPNPWYGTTSRWDKVISLWDGSQVTTLPSKDIHELITALNHIDPPTHDLLGERRIRDILSYDLYSVENDGMWRKTEWDLFSDTLNYCPDPNEYIWDHQSLDDFDGLSRLRFDSDLRNAGVKNCGLGVASIKGRYKRVVNTTPMVSIRLGGPGPACNYQDSPDSASGFLCVKVHEGNPNLQPTSSKTTESGSSRAPAPSDQRPGTAAGRKLRPQKRQRFEDFFREL